jgi:hypothetical protein
MSDHDMRNSGMLRRRGILKAAAAFGGLSTLAVIAPATPGAAQESEIPAAASPEVKLVDVLAGSNTKLTLERRGQIVLFGINRPYIQNRIDPDTFQKLGEAYYQYDHAPSLRAAILFGRGATLQGASTLKDLGRWQLRASPGSRALTERVAFLMKVLVIFAASFYLLLAESGHGRSVGLCHISARTKKTGSLNSIEARRVYLARILCPETGLEEIDGDLPQADFRPGIAPLQKAVRASEG